MVLFPVYVSFAVIPLSLGIRIASLRGTLRLCVKPPSSDHMWFGFTSVPDIDIHLNSSVGDQMVTGRNWPVGVTKRRMGETGSPSIDDGSGWKREKGRDGATGFASVTLILARSGRLVAGSGREAWAVVMGLSTGFGEQRIVVGYGRVATDLGRRVTAWEREGEIGGAGLHRPFGCWF
ncbi:hypothetical protein CQW23_24301 [Capsicum baccatum]|uniref:Uncharacterized protein n=1 Tax=Capsicum baccatum TaxID=33114 RepID=A0A2G2VUG2_CAPBA|nr:hypothetical protein CQW23_24301 [Capsicum baccatum]